MDYLLSKVLRASKRLSKELNRRPFLILSFGLFLFFLGASHYYQIRILSFSKPYPTVSKSQKGAPIPTRIKIPSIGVNLGVEEATIVKGVWEISFKGASHLDKSANLGEGGNVVIYGHNKDSLFGPIRWLKEGELIEVESSNGKKFTYKVAQTVEVSPDKIDYILPKAAETLTLYTCTGFADSKRFIIVANPLPSS